MEEQKTAPPVSRWKARRHGKEGPQTSVAQSQLDKTDESQSIRLSEQGKM